jgi:hypothetical protein
VEIANNFLTPVLYGFHDVLGNKLLDLESEVTAEFEHDGIFWTTQAENFES